MNADIRTQKPQKYAEAAKKQKVNLVSFAAFAKSLRLLRSAVKSSLCGFGALVRAWSSQGGALHPDIRTQKPQKLRRSRREIQFQLNALNPFFTGVLLRLLRNLCGFCVRLLGLAVP